MQEEVEVREARLAESRSGSRMGEDGDLGLLSSNTEERMPLCAKRPSGTG